MGIFQKRLAFLISRILGPLPLLCLLWLTVAVKSRIGFWKALWVYLLIFIITIAIPTAITTYLIIVKKVANIEWSNLADRKKYLLPTAIVSVICLVLLTKFLTNTTIFHLSLLLSIIILVMVSIWTIFNFKISGHIVIATVTVAGINLFLGGKFFWLFILLIPIVWARYVLKLHTLAQLLAGFFLPAAIMLLALFLFGWPNVP